MALKPKLVTRRPRSFTAARRRALARLRKGLDLGRAREGSREAVHDRSLDARVTSGLRDAIRRSKTVARCPKLEGGLSVICNGTSVRIAVDG